VVYTLFNRGPGRDSSGATAAMLAYGVANRGAAYTLTYSTPRSAAPSVAAVLPAVTQAAVLTTGSAQPNTNFGWDSGAHGDLLPVCINALQADSLILKQLLGALIDDLQAFTLVTGVRTSPLALQAGGVAATIAGDLPTFTQTYAVASRTVPAATALTPAAAGAAVVGTTPGFGFTTQAQADAIPVALNAMRADNTALFGIARAIIRAEQALGLGKPYRYVAGHLHRDLGEIACWAQLWTLTHPTDVTTVPVATAANVAVTGSVTLAAGANWGYPTAAQADSLIAAAIAALADLLALKQCIVSLILSRRALLLCS